MCVCGKCHQIGTRKTAVAELERTFPYKHTTHSSRLIRNEKPCLFRVATVDCLPGGALTGSRSSCCCYQPDGYSEALIVRIFLFFSSFVYDLQCCQLIIFLYYLKKKLTTILPCSVEGSKRQCCQIYNLHNSKKKNLAQFQKFTKMCF